MRTLLLVGFLCACDSKNGDSVSSTDDSAPADDSALADDLDGDGSASPDDCDDGDESIHPGAEEIVADGIDQDCDTLDLCFQDADGDGYGSSSTVKRASCDGAGASGTDDDCDDTDLAYHPGAKESCTEPIDYNCDDSVEYADADKDGWAACLECDDSDATRRPDAPEVANDAIDQDCDDGDVCYADADADGFGATDGTIVVSADLDCADAGEADDAEDCVDSGADAASTFPGAAPLDSKTSCMVDADGDDYGARIGPVGISFGQDCDDTQSNTYPGATEIPGDGLDQNCVTAEACYMDLDGDGYGTADVISSIDADCGDLGEAATPDDCLDTGDEAAVTYPGAAYNDSATACETDADGDGYGSDSPETGVTPGADCDDADSAVHCVAIHVGNDVEFTDASSHGANYLLGSALVVPSDMTVTALALIGKSAKANVRMALYTDSSGGPGSLVVETGSNPVPVGVLEIAVADTPISAGTYWIMGVYDVDASIGISFPKSEVVMYRSLSFSSAMPSTFGSAASYMGQVFNYYVVGY